MKNVKKLVKKDQLRNTELNLSPNESNSPVSKNKRTQEHSNSLNLEILNSEHWKFRHQYIGIHTWENLADTNIYDKSACNFGAFFGFFG